MPITAFVGTGLITQLQIHYAVYGHYETRLSGMCIEIKKNLTRINKVQVITERVVKINLALRTHYAVGPIIYIMIIFFISGGLPHSQHGLGSETLGITEKQTLAVIKLP